MPLSSGTYTAQAEQDDSSGNIGLSASRTFTVDTVAPKTTITAGPERRLAKRKARFTQGSSERRHFRVLDAAVPEL